MLFPPPLIVQLDPPPIGVHGWAPYVTPAATWSALPVALSFGTGPPPTIDATTARDELDVASRAWSLPPCSAARISVGATFAMAGDGANDGKNEVITHITDWPADLEPGAVAHTVIYLAGTTIVEADVHLNAHDWSFAVGDVPGKLDLRSVLTHELGHVLGVGHSDVPRATMNAGLPPGIAARSLEDDDTTAICALYPQSPPRYTGCDRGDACPSGYTCVGHDCEIAGEPGISGGSCASPPAGACDGAGDRASCVTTTMGDRCALPCPTDVDDDCGATLACVDGACLPIGAKESVDAGSDAIADGASDGSTAPSSSSGGCTSSGQSSGQSGSWWWSMLAVVTSAIRARRRGRRRSVRACPPDAPRHT